MLQIFNTVEDGLQELDQVTGRMLGCTDETDDGRTRNRVVYDRN